MRIGCCGSMISPATDATGIEVLEPLAALGFDYIELSLSDLTALSEEKFLELAARLARCGLRCESCNNFFPSRVRLTGPEARLSAALDHAGEALARAARLGVRVIVFGSSGAKNVPPGFPREEAWRQIVNLLQLLGPLAERHGITIVIEPISRPESNLVNRAADGLRLVREVDHPSVQLLVDYYHLMTEREDPEIVLEARTAIHHVHFAKVEGRAFPTQFEAAYARFFDYLRQIQYSGRCSIEAYTRDFANDAPRALAVLRGLAGRIPVG